MKNIDITTERKLDYIYFLQLLQEVRSISIHSTIYNSVFICEEFLIGKISQDYSKDISFRIYTYAEYIKFLSFLMIAFIPCILSTMFQ